tara:strand:- start:25 stop:396 length:372 start_codon:yes stop_codon:yes gene_type:complete
MSTLKVNTLQDASGGNSSTAEQIQQGRAKAWIRFNGSAMSIQASFNISSITDQGTGAYDVNFASAFSDANYAFAGMCSNDNNGLAIGSDTAAPSTTSARVIVFDSASGSGQQDSDNVGFVVFR